MASFSDYPYKGYTVRIKFTRLNGCIYKIFKQDTTGKWYNLREKVFNFCPPDNLKQKAFDYINEFEEKLIQKYERLINEVTKNSIYHGDKKTSK